MGKVKTMNCTPYAMYNDDIVKSEGCTLYDRQGNRYIDMEAGVWCAALGHGHEGVNRAMRTQLEQVAHVGYRYSHPVVEDAAEKLLDVLGMPEGQCVFLSAGSEAVEFGVQAARRIAGAEKPLVLCLDQFFLSSYGQSATRPAETWRSIALPSSGEEGWQTKIDALPFEQIGVFALEPGNASGTVNLPDAKVLAYLAGKVRAHGGLLVIDEVTTGIGRTGEWFGFMHYDLRPDIVACGKGLGNGYPVSAVAMRGEIASALLASGFRYAQSHQNDPLGCAVAHAVLTAMETEGVLANVHDVGAYCLGRLQAVAKEHPCVVSVRGRGLLIALTLAEDVPIKDIHRALYERGYFVGINLPRRVLRLYPPLVITREIVDGFIDALSAVLP